MKRMLLAALAALATACGPRHTIVATFTGFANDTVVMQARPLSQYASATPRPDIRTDTLRLDDAGRIAVDLDVTEPLVCHLMPMEYSEAGIPLAGGSFTFIAEPGQRLAFEFIARDNWLEVNAADGSAINGDLAQYANAWNPVGAGMGRMQAAMIQLRGKPASDSLQQAYRASVKRAQEANETYIAAHLDRPSSIFVLNQSGSATVERYFDSLRPDARNSIFRPLADQIELQLEGMRVRREAAERLKPGVEAPNFTLPDTEGRPVSLSSLRGKWVVLDFWGSWCIWCIKGFPELKRCHEKYRGRLEIVGIDCSDSREKWIEAIGKHELPWINLLDTRKGRPAEIIDNVYGIGAYPTKILIDPKGRIVDISVGERPGFSEKLEASLLAAGVPGRPESSGGKVSGTAVAATARFHVDSVVQLRGRVVMAHEVRSFIPEGDTVEYWIVDRSGALEREYDRATGGQKNGMPARVELKARYKGATDEGFAAGYEGVFEVVELVSVEKAEE